MRHKPTITKIDTNNIIIKDILTAAHDFGGATFKLYIYMVFNGENYTVEDAAEKLNLTTKTIYNSFKELWEKGYLVRTSPDNYNFFQKVEEKVE